MTRREIIKQQLIHGIPEVWITEELLEAIELIWGGRVLRFPAPELAEDRHAVALLRYAGQVAE